MSSYDGKPKLSNWELHHIGTGEMKTYWERPDWINKVDELTWEMNIIQSNFLVDILNADLSHKERRQIAKAINEVCKLAPVNIN